MRDYAELLKHSAVPEHLHDGLVLYLTHGVPPGHFLMAVLSNDLVESFARADEQSRHGLFALVEFLYNWAPASSWGDLNRVVTWMEERRAERVAVQS